MGGQNMRDNKTSQPAHEYDGKVEKTIPFYSTFHEQTLDLIETVKPNPSLWMDSGGGTGNLIYKAAKKFPNTRFVLTDPSEAMLDIAKDKFFDSCLDVEYVLAGTQNINFQNESFDVITAIISHHYFDADTRRNVTENCFRMLKEGGIYVAFESIRPITDKGLDIGLKRWKNAQLKQGKKIEKVEHHLSRYDVEFFPISIQAHLDLLQETGFSTVELFWYSFMQAGLYAIK